MDSVDSAALSRDMKIGSHWYWAGPGFADNSDINKTIEQPLSKNYKTRPICIGGKKVVKLSFGVPIEPVHKN